MSEHVLKVHPNDNVIVALQDLPAGSSITYMGQTVVLLDKIPAKHKYLTEDRKEGEPVFMYGVLVGKAMKAIPKGSLIHTGNLKHASAPYSGKSRTYTWQPPDLKSFQNRTFQGYHRKDGSVGTANYWIFVPTVFCENRNLDVIREACGTNLATVYRTNTGSTPASCSGIWPPDREQAWMKPSSPKPKAAFSPMWMASNF
jgi:altronate hydrolase